MKVYTIFYKGYDGRYGHESSQVSRQKVFDTLGITHTVVLGLPLPYPDWRKRMMDTGYTQFVSTCNLYSDIADDSLSVTVGMYVDNQDVTVIEKQEQSVTIVEAGIEKTIHVNEDGYISYIEDDTFLYFYTSAMYLKKEKATAFLYWYQKDGTLSLRGEPSVKADYMFYDQDNQLIGNTDTLMKRFLVQTLQECDCLIYDKLFSIAGDLKRYLRMKKIRTYQVIHYNVLAPMFSSVLPQLKPWLRYLVASEMLLEPLQQLGLDVHFVPPMHSDVVAPKTVHQRIRNYCLVGSYSHIKRIDMAVEAFAELERRGIDVTLTVYGGDHDNIEQFTSQHEIPKNVTFMSKVDTVPYAHHQAYISCSQSECFANAMVEASSYSLALVLSKVDLAHTYHARQHADIRVFETLEELVTTIIELAEHGGKTVPEIAQKYALENVANIYRKVFLN